MKLPILSASVSVHCHVTEDEDKVMRALRAVIPTDAKVDRIELEGHHGNPIIALSARIREKTKLLEIWERIVTECGGVIVSQIEERTDEHCALHLRFDKQAAFEGTLALTKGGDSIHLKLKIRAFPPRKDNAIRLLKEVLAGG